MSTKIITFFKNQFLEFQAICGLAGEVTARDIKEELQHFSGWSQDTPTMARWCRSIGIFGSCMGCSSVLQSRS